MAIKKSLTFLGFPFSDPLDSEGLLRFFLSNSMGVSKFLSSIEPSLEYRRPKENPTNSPLCSLALNDPSRSASFTPFRIVLYSFYIQTSRAFSSTQ